MTTNPKPNDAFAILDAESSISFTDTHRTIRTNLLKMQRRMFWILFQKFIVFVSKLLNGIREFAICDSIPRKLTTRDDS